MKDEQKTEKKKQQKLRISSYKEFEPCFEYDSAFNCQDSKTDSQKKKSIHGGKSCSMEVRTVPSFGISLDVSMVKVIEVLVLIVHTEPKPGVCQL